MSNNLALTVEKYGSVVNPFLLNPQGLNTYSYADNNPINKSDPSGACPICFVAAGFAIYALLYPDQQAYAPSTNNMPGPQLYTRTSADNFVTGARIAPLVMGVAGLAAAGVKNLAAMIARNTASEITGAGSGRSMSSLFSGIQGFDAAAQQRGVLQGISNSRLAETFRVLYQTSDTLPGGTAGAVINEAMTGIETEGKFHLGKAMNTLGRLNNILKEEKLTQFEIQRTNDEILNLRGAINTANSFKK